MSPTKPADEGAGPRRVLFVSFNHPEVVRGGEQQVAYELFCAARDDPDWSATLLAACDGGEHPGLIKPGAFITGFDGRPGEHLFLGQAFDHFLQRNLNPQAIDRFREFLREVRPDVVHFHHTLLIGAELITVTRAECPNARILFTFHEFVSICHAQGQMIRSQNGGLCTYSSPYRCHECFPDVVPDHFYVRKRYLMEHFRHVDRFVAPTRMVRERYVAWGLPEDKFSVIPNGGSNVAATARAPRRRGAPTRNRFGYFGQLIDNKGLHVLLEAAIELVERDVRDFSVAVFGGNHEYATEAYRKRIDELLERLTELEFSGVRFHGRYDHAQLPYLMGLVDWVVVPSTWWEIFGLVVSEAWMFERPVIASDIGGLAERIEHEKNGLLFQPGSAADLADALQRAIEEPELWARLSAATEPPISPAVAWNAHVRAIEGPGLR